MQTQRSKGARAATPDQLDVSMPPAPTPDTQLQLFPKTLIVDLAKGYGGATSRVLSLLRDEGYDRWVSFEWEKKWHPEIEDPEVAFPQYAKVMAEYLSAPSASLR